MNKTTGPYDMPVLYFLRPIRTESRDAHKAVTPIIRIVNTWYVIFPIRTPSAFDAGLVMKTITMQVRKMARNSTRNIPAVINRAFITLISYFPPIANLHTSHIPKRSSKQIYERCRLTPSLIELREEAHDAYPARETSKVNAQLRSTQSDNRLSACSRYEASFILLLHWLGLVKPQGVVKKKAHHPVGLLVYYLPRLDDYRTAIMEMGAA